MINKICRSCRECKILDKFVKDKIYKDGRSNLCKECANEIKRDRRTDRRNITAEDRQMARKLLESLGYVFDSELSIHEQFMLKHNLVKSKS
jgi:superfamily II helicase